MRPALSYQEALKAIVGCVDPIVRLEAIQISELLGRTTAVAPDPERGDCGRTGKTLGARELAEMVASEEEEVVVFSRPSVIGILSMQECDPFEIDSRAELLTRLSVRCGGKSQVLYSPGGGMTDRMEQNYGTDILVIVCASEEEREEVLVKLGRDGRSLFSDVGLAPGGRTSMFLVEDNPVLVPPITTSDLIASLLAFLPAIVAKVSRITTWVSEDRPLTASLRWKTDVATVQLFSSLPEGYHQIPAPIDWKKLITADAFGILLPGDEIPAGSYIQLWQL